MSRTRSALVAAVFAVLAPAWTAIVGTQTLEYEVKAAFLYNLMTFTEWPAPAFSSADEPFRLCVVGRDPFGPVLDRTVDGESIQGHRITVERVRAAEADRCHVVYVPAAETRSMAVFARSATRALTVGESDDAMRRGAMVSFVVESGRVRFDVNTSAASTHGLRFSSRLLRIARNTLTDGEN